MKYLVAYASSEGQTQTIARHVADRIFDAGHFVELVQLSAAGDVDLGKFDGVILAASIHVGHYQRALSEFVAERRDALGHARTLFLSVSLAAAGHEAEDWKSLSRILSDFEEATGWTPGRAEQIAGAYRPSKYDIFRRFVMRRIMAVKEPGADLDADREYTDWAALDGLIDGWVDPTKD